MKTYKLDKINLSRYRSLILKFTGIVIIIIVLVIYILSYIFKNLQNISLIIIVLIITSSFFIGKFVNNRAITEVVVKLDNKFILVNEEKIEIRNVSNLRIYKNIFNLYPRVLIKLNNNRKISFNIVKYSKDYLVFLEGLNDLKL